MEAKVRAAVSERLDPATFIFARTDARAVHGLDDALRRAERYLRAGAEGLFIEAPESVEELRRIGRAFDGVPLVANPLEGGKTPLLSPAEFAELGFTVIPYGITLILHAAQAMQAAIADVMSGAFARRDAAMSFRDYLAVVGEPGWAAAGRSTDASRTRPSATRPRKVYRLLILRHASGAKCGEFDKNSCIACPNYLCAKLPNFARACGRVSVGRYPDKRPDSRLGRRSSRKEKSSSKNSDRQPEAKPANSVLNGGRDLKQRRSGLFWSLPALHKPAGNRRGLSFIAGRAAGSPHPIQGRLSRLSNATLVASSIARQRGVRIRHHSDARALALRTAVWGEHHDRAHPRIPASTAPTTGPVLVVDLDVVRDNYNAFAKALPDTRVFYAVKANPAPEVLSLLATLGSCFDTASVAEIEMVLAAGATPDRISYGNTIKKERDIARAYRAGRPPVRGRLQGRGREGRPRGRPARRCSAASCATAPAPNGRCRASSAASRRWPSDVLEHAHRLGLEAYGVSFHVGSQQRNQQCLGPRPRVGGGRCSASAASAASTCRWSTSAAASRPST